MNTGVVKPIHFKVEQEQYLVVDKTAIIQAFLDQFKLKLSEEDIKILKDGLQLQINLGTRNKIIPVPTFKQTPGIFIDDHIDKVSFDEQTFKIWVDVDANHLFVDAGDSKLQVQDAGVDAPTGTIQVSIEEGQVYTLLYADETKINEAITASLALVNKMISTKPMTINNQVDDQRVSILRKKFGKPDKGYNDRVIFKTPVVKKILIHV